MFEMNAGGERKEAHLTCETRRQKAGVDAMHDEGRDWLH